MKDQDHDAERDELETEDDRILVRDLRKGDLDALVRIDRHATGGDRRPYYEMRLADALDSTGIRISLGAEVDGAVVGFVLGRVYHGEYGRCEPVATIDTVGVSPDFRRQGVGHALFRQLRKNLEGLRVERVETEVEWDRWSLLEFLAREGFRPAPRLSLDLQLNERP